MVVAGSKKPRRKRALFAMVLVLVVAAIWVWSRSGRSHEEVMLLLKEIEGSRGNITEIEHLLGKPDWVEDTPPSWRTTEPRKNYFWCLSRMSLFSEEVLSIDVDTDANGRIQGAWPYQRQVEGTSVWQLRWLRLRHLWEPTSEYPDYVRGMTFSF